MATRHRLDVQSIRQEFSIFESGDVSYGDRKVSGRQIMNRNSSPQLSKNINPNVAKVGGLQSQGEKGEAVVIYCEPFATRDLKLSDFSEG